MGLAQETLEIVQRPIVRVHVVVIGDIVAVVLERRGVERQNPDGGHAQVGQIVELLGQAVEIADAVAVGIPKALDMDFIDDRVLVPQGIIGERPLLGWHGRILLAGVCGLGFLPRVRVIF